MESGGQAFLISRGSLSLLGLGMTNFPFFLARISRITRFFERIFRIYYFSECESGGAILLERFYYLS